LGTLFGWSGRTLPPAERDALRARMGARAAGGAPPAAALECAATDDTLLCAESVAQRGTVIAAITGMPRWRSPELAKVARQRGHAAALLDAWSRSPRGWTSELADRFACAIAVTSERRVLLASDRMGSGPLAYSLVGNALVFASTCDEVLAFPGVSPLLSHQALFNYVYFHMVPSPDTAFAAIAKLEPAQLADWRGGRIALTRHWLPEFADPNQPLEDGLGAELQRRLETAVRRCEPSDSTAAFLSGGLDSSSVAGMLARVRPKPARTYSMGFDQEGYDEMRYARIAAKHFRLDSREYYVQHEDVVAALPAVAAAYDEPFGNSSAVPTLLCARAARAEGFDQLLAGDGGDEIFGGNERYAGQKIFEVYRELPSPLRRGLVDPFVDNLPRWLRFFPLDKLVSYVEQARVPMPERLQTWNYVFREGVARMFEPAFLERVELDAPAALQKRTYEDAPTPELVDRMLYFDWKFTLADNDLRKVGRMCEIAGVRVSYPMLDGTSTGGRCRTSCRARS
jgi:asparagine synthase (glutamine-hydrolysing)